MNYGGHGQIHNVDIYDYMAIFYNICGNVLMANDTCSRQETKYNHMVGLFLCQIEIKMIRVIIRLYTLMIIVSHTLVRQIARV